MQAAIVVKDGSSVIQKRVYGGAIDSDTMNAEKARLEAKYPSYTFTVYADDQDSAYTSIVIDTPTMLD